MVGTASAAGAASGPADVEPAAPAEYWAIGKRTRVVRPTRIARAVARDEVIVVPTDHGWMRYVGYAD